VNAPPSLPRRSTVKDSLTVGLPATATSKAPVPQGGEIVLYQTDDGGTGIQCCFDGETIWLTQVEMADLFQTSVPNINIHLKAIYAECELSEAATIKSYLTVRSEGVRQVTRDVLHYRYRQTTPDLQSPQTKKPRRCPVTAKPKENGHSCPLVEKNHGLENPCSKAPTGRPYDSPGQRPGSNAPMKSGALKGRNNGGGK